MFQKRILEQGEKHGYLGCIALSDVGLANTSEDDSHDGDRELDYRDVQDD